MRTTDRRGQTLVLFALTLLLLVLAVLITVSLGVRIKERVELQTLADTAAYNNAIATARTFNSMAVLNRTQWSLAVAQSASQAYLSWATLYRGAIEAAENSLEGFESTCPGSETEDATEIIALRLAMEKARVMAIWHALEPEGHEELRKLSLVQRRLLREGTYRQYEHLEYLVGKGRMTDIVLNRARPANYWPVTSKTDLELFRTQISRDCKVGVACDIGGSNFKKNRADWDILSHQHEIYAGSRGDAFTTARQDAQKILDRRMSAFLGGTVTWRGIGSSYRGHTTWTHGADYAVGGSTKLDTRPSSNGLSIMTASTGGPPGPLPPNIPSSPFSDDHGRVDFAIMFGDCLATASVRMETRLRATTEIEDSVHVWGVGDEWTHCEYERDPSHSLADLGGGQGWPLVIDFNDDAAPGAHLNGQPNLTVELFREFTFDHQDPWDLNVATPNAEFKLRPADVARTRQRAVASAVAYYHRGGHWAEAPNFVNPFWRATLISSRWSEP